MIHNKLVRDKIPDLIRANGEAVEVERLTGRRLDTELRAKVAEEAAELITAGTRKALVMELADVMEAVGALRRYHNITPAEVERVRLDKRKACGGFDGGTFLVSMEQKK